MEFYFSPASQEHQKREKAKARELRASQWWKQELGKGVCYYCNGHFKSEELTMDHITPIVRGGSTSKHNCVTACKDCNNKKGYKLPVEMVMESLPKA